MRNDIIIVGLPQYLTLIKPYINNIKVFQPSNCYVIDSYIGYNQILYSNFIQPAIVGENKEIFRYKTQDFFEIYDYYYPLQSFESILINKEFLKGLENNYKKVILILPINLIFSTEIAGSYFYFKKIYSSKENDVILYSNFDNRIMEYQYNNIRTRFYLEPIGKSTKFIRVKEYIVNDTIPKNFILANIKNNNQSIVEIVREEINV